jgi:hypothetical protein
VDGSRSGLPAEYLSTVREEEEDLEVEGLLNHPPLFGENGDESLAGFPERKNCSSGDGALDL